ncbi:hypothetical protein FOC1_g10001674 [Fusarium oxysporum f. sp. cubense race 1]|uniref:Uncharacterized protein n=1 Tax=Fusarium oxysporum f. sp. cubense (strain race 1) TaxID=1229664 RepID=N4UA60_FUSC1|nr:hypothetical protein FOC1_g10001674 [Fusarium oxysporum f. sp. cubense race 1]
MNFGIEQHIHQRHTFALFKNESQNYVPSKRQSESRSEGNTKKRKTKRHQFNATEIFSSSEDEEDQSPKANNHESMTRHIAAHLQTLMLLTLRVIAMQKGLGSEEEDAAESNAGVLKSARRQNPPRSSYYGGSGSSNGSLSRWQCVSYYQYYTYIER